MDDRHRSILHIIYRSMQAAILLLASAGLMLALQGCNAEEEADLSGIRQYSGYTLVWHDEFVGEEIDPSNWVFETGDGTDYGLPRGWGNNELQLYKADKEHARISNGNLMVVAYQNGDGSYSSAKLTTNGLVSVRYGRVEAKIKLPQGQGIWPAFWMLGDNRPEIDWPGCGEIDILELLGHDPNTIYHTVHYTDRENRHGSHQGANTAASSYSDDYHIYTLDWTPERMIFKIDGVVTHETPIEDDMKEFQRSMYLILNLAVGGNWPGNPDETTIFPQTMLVDYVRVYEQNGFTPAPPPTLNLEEETFGQYLDPNLYANAIADGFTGFGEMEMDAFGDGGMPAISESTDAMDGDQSLALDYPGEGWGGMFFRMKETKDLSAMAAGTLKFAIKPSGVLSDAEVKLEGPDQITFAQAFLMDYPSTDLGDGWKEYAIPMADFVNLDLGEVSVPFSLWNPRADEDNYFKGNILIDNVRIE